MESFGAYCELAMASIILEDFNLPLLTRGRFDRYLTFVLSDLFK